MKELVHGEYEQRLVKMLKSTLNGGKYNQSTKYICSIGSKMHCWDNEMEQRRVREHGSDDRKDTKVSLSGAGSYSMKGSGVHYLSVPWL